MINKIRLYNFRSIEKAEIEIAPLTVLYGPTASGKSSLLYSLIILKNFIINPNQHSDGFFNLGFINLGGFEDCIFDHKNEQSIDIYFSVENGEYGISLKKSSADIYLNSTIIKMKGNVSIPYAVNKKFPFVIKSSNGDSQEYNLDWNGIITTSVTPKQPTAEAQQEATSICQKLNQVPEYLKKIDIAPHKRGFFKPSYSPIQVSLNPISDDEMSTIIINDRYLAPKISVDLEKILNKDFRIYTPPGTATVFFQATDKSSRTSNNLVNEGFGVNQIVYLLTKIHRAEIRTILIEEPEVHLHPSIIRALVKTLCSIIKEENKQIILTTHSEVLVSSLLASVRKRDILPQEVKCYLVKKVGKCTKFEEQKINEKGQIEGGLTSFMEGELEDLKVFFEKSKT